MADTYKTGNAELDQQIKERMERETFTSYGRDVSELTHAELVDLAKWMMARLEVLQAHAQEAVDAYVKHAASQPNEILRDMPMKEAERRSITPITTPPMNYTHYLSMTDAERAALLRKQKPTE